MVADRRVPAAARRWPQSHTVETQRRTPCRSDDPFDPRGVERHGKPLSPNNTAGRIRRVCRLVSHRRPYRGTPSPPTSQSPQSRIPPLPPSLGPHSIPHIPPHIPRSSLTLICPDSTLPPPQFPDPHRGLSFATPIRPAAWSVANGHRQSAPGYPGRTMPTPRTFNPREGAFDGSSNQPGTTCERLGATIPMRCCHI